MSNKGTITLHGDGTVTVKSDPPRPVRFRGFGADATIHFNEDGSIDRVENRGEVPLVRHEPGGGS